MSILKPKKKQTQQQLQQVYLDIFKTFSQDGLYIKATEFVGVGKLLKIHPVIITFDQFKKVLLRSPEYWNSKKDMKYINNEVISATFSPSDFLRAFKIIAKVGYKHIEDTNQNKFIMLTNYLKKQLNSFANKREKLANDLQSDARSVKTAYDQTQYNAINQQLMKHQYSNSIHSTQPVNQYTQQVKIATSPGNAYSEVNHQIHTPTHYENTGGIQDKRLSGTDAQANFIHSTLSNDYRVYQSINPSTNAKTSTNGLNTTQWRFCNSEIKSDISQRAFSTAVRTSQSKGRGMIIPKGLLKKKFKQNPQMSVTNYLTYKTNLRTITGKSNSSVKGQRTGVHEIQRNSYSGAQYSTIQVQDTRNKTPSVTRSINENPMNISNQNHKSLNTMIIPKVQMQNVPKLQTQELSTQNVNILDDNNFNTIDGSQSGNRQQSQSFRIRKFSRSMSRQSRSSSVNSQRDENALDGLNTSKNNENLSDAKQENPLRDSINVKDISLSNNQIYQQKNQQDNTITIKQYKAILKESKQYKKERDDLIKVLKQVKRKFLEFASTNPQTLKLSQSQSMMPKSDTGNSCSQEVQEQLQLKDERIKQLEEEIRILKQQKDTQIEEDITLNQ
ncbi:UNKNOWN [Stylonychia lemnae]|uniref:Uncharacterized protein n=1 Tax=Stylonychia lemnae TaxID=5949 RepID=A0A077ZRZ8_STYLE|nr:UNKNOWN [Stylonychia lemnae]|eukprot:CDW72130.1 UNKNOWN [Stylonychia lemnae]